MGVTRFQHGISTAHSRDPLNNFGLPDPSKYVSYFNDFITSSNYSATTEYILTQVGGTVEVTASAQHGLLTITTGATSNDHGFLQLRGFPILPTSGKRIFFKTRLSVNVLTSASIIAGLQNVDTTPLDFTDGIVFSRATTATTWTAMSRKDATTGATQVTGLGVLGANTFTTLGFYYDGRRSIEFFIADKKVTTIDVGTTNAFLPNTNLTPSFGIQTTEAVAKILTMDYIFVACER